MPDVDAFLMNWVDELKAMQNCMRQVNTSTSEDLSTFFKQKHADLLLSDMQKEQFRSCFFHQTQITIPDIDFTNGSTFHEVLDLCFRPLLVAVLSVMRDSASLDDPQFGGMSLGDFGAVRASAAFPSDAAIQAVCGRLTEDRSPLPQDGLQALLQKPGTTVLAAAQTIS